MSRRSMVEQTARAERMSAIRRCRHCDSSGWRLGCDGLPADIARRCDHSPPAQVRDITEPVYQLQLTEE